MAKKPLRVKAADPVAVFRLLSDPHRYRALALLSGQKSGLLVGDIADSLGMGHSAASHLLSVLHRAGVVSFQREGRRVRYALLRTPAARSVLRVMRAG